MKLFRPRDFASLWAMIGAVPKTNLKLELCFVIFYFHNHGAYWTLRFSIFVSTGSLWTIDNYFPSLATLKLRGSLELCPLHYQVALLYCACWKGSSRRRSWWALLSHKYYYAGSGRLIDLLNYASNVTEQKSLVWFNPITEVTKWLVVKQSYACTVKKLLFKLFK